MVFAVVKWIEDGLLIGMAYSLISIRIFDLSDKFPIGFKSYELGNSEWVCILNIDERDEDTGNVFPNVLSGEDECFPVEGGVRKIELNELNVHLNVRSSE